LTGLFTATESAAIAVLYAFFITFFVYRDIKLSSMGIILKRTFKTLAMVLFLIGASSSFGWLLALLEVPSLVSNGLINFSPNAVITLLIMIVIMLVLGMVMDMAPLILIITPILLPVATNIGMDPIHFGVVLMLALGVGL